MAAIQGIHFMGLLLSLAIIRAPAQLRKPDRIALMKWAPKIVLLSVLTSCATPVRETATTMNTFGDDVTFLRDHTEVIVLSDPSTGARVAVAPAYQGRVMTSSAKGDDGTSYGWLNRKAIASGERQPHINVFGGEDRFWLGPEGGQFSIFFKRGDPFDLDHWQTPEPIDWGAWDVVDQTESHAHFHNEIELVNYSGTKLALEADRVIRLVGADSNVDVVGFQSENTITNTGEEAWTPESGMLSIWILGMFNPSPKTTIVIPFRTGTEEELGPIVNDAYFGKVPEERLVIRDGVIFFRGDGKYRSKIGIPRPRALPVAGSYDADSGVLTVVEYSLPEEATEYVNSMWEIQEEPFRGDVVNSYNDGPPEPGAEPLGPFYELETSSPAAALAPGESITHVHRTFHFQGAPEDLDAIARDKLGVALADIVSIFE
jgi:hypothetical protein